MTTKEIAIRLLITVQLLCESLACVDIAECICDNIELQCRGADYKSIPYPLPDTLTSVVMDHGQLTTVEASSLFRLRNLTILQLEHNQIDYIEEDTFRYLASLRKISLHANALDNLDAGVFSALKHLEVLKLSENVLETLDGALDGLDSLQVLVANDNLLHHINSETFKHLKNLQRLELGNNRLSHFEPETFRHNPNLISLGMGSNPILSFEKLFSNDSVLHFMNISNCNLTKFPPDLPASLQFLTLTKNQITEIRKSDTVKYVNLNSLVLEGNNLSYVENGAFLHTLGLTSLYLYVNALREVPGPFTQNIKQIYLDDNEITSLAEDMFLPGTHLETLSLKNNNLNTLTFSLPKKFRMGALHLEGNPVQILRDNMFLPLSGLKHLVLNRLHLQVIFVDCFLGLFSLKTLEMSYVKLESDYVDFLRNIHTLSILTFKNSPRLAEYLLESLMFNDARLRLNNLTELNLENNHLTTLDKSLMMLPRLERMYLAGNQFHCTDKLLWLRAWYITQPHVLLDLNTVLCQSPREAKGQRFLDVNLIHFDKPTTFSPNDMNNDTNYDYSMYPHGDYQDYNPDNYPIYDPDNYPTYDPDNYQIYDNYYVNYNDDHISNATDSMPSNSTEATISTHSSSPQDTDGHTVLPTNSSDFYNNTSAMDTTEAFTDKSEVDTNADTTLETMTASTKKPETSTSNPMQTLLTTAQDVNINEDTNTDTLDDGHSSSLTVKNIGIAIGTSIGVIILMLLIAAIIFLLWRRKKAVVHHNAREYPKDNYVFIVSKTETATDTTTPQRKLTREERGSTTSRASEDITNRTDNSMKVYMLDVDS